MTQLTTLADYLHSTGSLTALLEAKAGKALTVQVLYEGFRPLTRPEKQSLGLVLHRPALGKVRTVALYGNDAEPWVRATSIFPLAHLTGSAKRLQHLKTTPIGYVLFKRRRTLPHTRTVRFDNDLNAWGRHTVYDWYGKKLLISEWFLPEFAARLG
ncbi:hypothetical protein B0181_06825 [Moraxella caviae]|uniref:Chorismate--pyruvate lyase n=1 Tax=Moraxella caviae TaxID=34060 RepID=A0A1T0A1A8_9GAMM|nr:chorismate lyase [Moraxella caviae]OOR89389.1 hypothetical protein B0181_06825 [Moraxella caviae]STZ09890.1 Chorismate--pyruvate lyase [Moraxella caviae]